MSTAKRDIIKFINQMPDDISRQELLDKLYVNERLELSREDYRKNGGIPHDEFSRRLEAKFAAIREGAQ